MLGADVSTGRRLLVLSLTLSFLGGCQRGSEEAAELEAVDVVPAPVIETAEDPTAVERPPELVGILPSSFPSDLPLYLPASLVDFGTGEQGPYVSLLTPHRRSRVERELTALARKGGWNAAAAGDDAQVLRKGDQRVRLRIEDGQPGTLYHFDY